VHEQNQTQVATRNRTVRSAVGGKALPLENCWMVLMNAMTSLRPYVVSRSKSSLRIMRTAKARPVILTLACSLQESHAMQSMFCDMVWKFDRMILINFALSSSLWKRFRSARSILNACVAASSFWTCLSSWSTSDLVRPVSSWDPQEKSYSNSLGSTFFRARNRNNHVK